MHRRARKGGTCPSRLLRLFASPHSSHCRGRCPRLSALARGRGAQIKRDRRTPRLFCLRPHLRDSLWPFGLRLPLWCAGNPHFPKCRRDPILLPESFCIPLRRRGIRGLSRNPSSDLYCLFRPPVLYIRSKKTGTDPRVFVQIEYNTASCQSQGTNVHPHSPCFLPEPIPAQARRKSI